MGGGEALAQSGGYIFEAEFLGHSCEDTLVAFGVGVAALYVSVGLEAEAKLRILFVADANVDIFHKGLHNRLSFLLCPELLAEVEVAGNGHTVTLGSLTGQTGKFGSLVGDCGSDAAPVEPVGTFHNSVEVEIFGISFGDGRTGTVVNHFGGAHRSTGLAIIDTHAIAAAGDKVGVYTIAAQSVQRSLADFVCGKFAHKVSIMAIIGAAHSHIGLAAAPDYVERVDLHKTFAPLGRKAKHNFA